MLSNFATMAFPPYPRRELRAQIVGLRQRTGSPMPDDAIDEIVDIACHAAEVGRRAMLEVIDRASDPRVSTTAVGIAGSLLAHDLRLLAEGLQHAAKVTGAHFETSTLKVQANG